MHAPVAMPMGLAQGGPSFLRFHPQNAFGLHPGHAGAPALPVAPGGQSFDQYQQFHLPPGVSGPRDGRLVAMQPSYEMSLATSQTVAKAGLAGAGRTNAPAPEEQDDIHSDAVLALQSLKSSLGVRGQSSGLPAAVQEQRGSRHLLAAKLEPGPAVRKLPESERRMVAPNYGGNGAMASMGGPVPRSLGLDDGLGPRNALNVQNSPLAPGRGSGSNGTCMAGPLENAGIVLQRPALDREEAASGGLGGAPDASQQSDTRTLANLSTARAGAIGLKRTREDSESAQPPAQREELARLLARARGLPTMEEVAATARLAVLREIRAGGIDHLVAFAEDLVEPFLGAEQPSGPGAPEKGRISVELQAAFSRAICVAVKSVCQTCSEAAARSDAWTELVDADFSERTSSDSGEASADAETSVRLRCSRVGQQAIQILLDACTIPVAVYKFPVKGDGVNPLGLDVSMLGMKRERSAGSSKSTQDSGPTPAETHAGQSAGTAAASSGMSSMSNWSHSSCSAQRNEMCDPPSDLKGLSPGLAARAGFLSRYQVTVSPAMNAITGVQIGGASQSAMTKHGVQYLIEGGASHLPYHCAIVFAPTLGRQFVVQQSYPFVGLVGRELRSAEEGARSSAAGAPHPGSYSQQVILTSQEYVHTMLEVQRWLDSSRASHDPLSCFRAGLNAVLLPTGKVVSARTTPVDLVSLCIPQRHESYGWFTAQEAAERLSRTDPVESTP